MQFIRGIENIDIKVEEKWKQQSKYKVTNILFANSEESVAMVAAEVL